MAFFILLAGIGRSQTIISDTNYTQTVLECVSDYVDFNDVVRYFSGLVVKQGTRLYYLDHPYSLEVLPGRIVFDDADKYTDRVTVYLGFTGYADMEEFKEAAVACYPGTATTDTIPPLTIDSLTYWGDTLRLYVNGNPVPYSTYIDSCPCEAPPPPPECVYVMGDPGTGEVVGDPGTGQVLFVQECPGGGGAFFQTVKKRNLNSGPLPAETMLAAVEREGENRAR